MSNLQDITTYGTYLQYIAETQAFTLEEKELLCNRNAIASNRQMADVRIIYFMFKFFTNLVNYYWK